MRDSPDAAYLRQTLTSLLHCDSDTIRSLTEKQWEDLVRIARYAGVLGRLSYLLKDIPAYANVPAQVKAHMQAMAAYADAQARQVRFESHHLAAVLKSAGVNQHLFLKGAAYVIGNENVAAGRTFSDIDLLVPKDEINKAERKLNLYGWFMDKYSDYDQRYYREWSHEIPPLKHSARGTVLDLHHNLVPPISGRAPDMVEFWSLATSTDNKRFVLSDAGMALHSIVHLFCQEEFSHGFRDLTDIFLIFTANEHNQSFWQSLLRLAEKTGFTRELFYAVRYSSSILDAPCPSWVIEETDKFAPSQFVLRYHDWLFDAVLSPHHSLCKQRLFELKHLLAMNRGHWIKMPLTILIRHTVTKIAQSVITMVTGNDPKHGRENNQRQ